MPEIGWERLRAEYVHEIRWWRIDEILEMTAEESTEERPTEFAPRRLGEFMLQLMCRGIPDPPIDVGI